MDTFTWKIFFIFCIFWLTLLYDRPTEIYQQMYESLQNFAMTKSIATQFVGLGNFNEELTNLSLNITEISTKALTVHQLKDISKFLNYKKEITGFFDKIVHNLKPNNWIATLSNIHNIVLNNNTDENSVKNKLSNGQTQKLDFKHLNFIEKMAKTYAFKSFIQRSRNMANNCLHLLCIAVPDFFQQLIDGFIHYIIASKIFYINLIYHQYHF